jgi:biotin operon repressor
MKGIDTRRFLLNTRKPEWCRPVDILLVAIVIDLANDEGECWASQETLGKLVGLDPNNVRKAIGRLVEHGWMIKTQRSHTQQTNILRPQLHNIPFGIGKPKVLTAETRRLAGRYYEIVKALPKVLTKNNRYRAAAYPHKSWPQHWGLVMQGWISQGWTAEQIQTVVDYAFQHHVDTAKRGPQCIKRTFSKLAAAAGVTL